MKQSTFFFICVSIAFSSLAVGVIGAIHEKRKEKKHKPAATLRDLYEDNAASEPSIFDISPESCYDTSFDVDPFSDPFSSCDLCDTLFASERVYLDV